MKALIITITQECNYTCKYCTMKGFIIPPGGKFENDLYPGVKITNKALIKWLKAYIRPAEWHIKITGGEPGLYKGIDKLLPALSKLGYKGIVETNGSLPVPNSDNFVRVGAWHKDRPQPKYFDVILITKNPDDDWRSKKDFCEVWDIPYKCAPFKHPGFHSNPNYDNPFPTLDTYGYDGMLCIYAAGQFKGCPKCPDTGAGTGSIFNMDKPTPYIFAERACLGGSKCTTLLGLKYFMPYVFDKRN